MIGFFGTSILGDNVSVRKLVLDSWDIGESVSPPIVTPPTSEFGLPERFAN